MINLDRTYVHLAADGAAASVPGGEAFWSLPPAAMEQYGHGWLLTQFECCADWPAWEMHPRGDEFPYLLSGKLTLLLEKPAGREAIELTAAQAFLIPQGIWHTARVSAPARMLFITRGAGTEHRSA